MSNTVEVKSNIAGRLSKIRDGVVFNSITSVISELGQNAQRAIAQAVKDGKFDKIEDGTLTIVIENDSITFSDNGCGCADPQVVLELDVSGFGVGFGEGISSIFYIADNVKLSSNDWAVDIDINKMIHDGDFSLPVIHHAKTDEGFWISLYGKKIADNYDELVDFTESMARLLPMTVILNGEVIPKKDLHKMKGADFKMHFDNELFEATIGITTRWNDLQAYYESRLVCGLWETGIKGNIVLKEGAATLKAPDRRDIVYDEKRTKLIEKIQECRKELYKEFIKVGTDLLIDTYAERIAELLDVTDYINILPMNQASTKAINAKKLEEEKKEMSDEEILRRAQMDDKRYSYGSGGSNIGGEGFLPDGYEPVDIGDAEDRNERAHKLSADIIQIRAKELKENEAFLNKIKDSSVKHKIVWLSASEADMFVDQVKDLEYHGFATMIARNRMYEKAFEYLGIINIHDVSKDVKVKYNVTNIGIANKKERRVMWMLEKIEDHYNIPNTFRIADIESTIEHYRNGVHIDTDKLVVGGIFQEDKGGRKRIYIDRSTLKLPKYKVTVWESDRLVMNDLRLMLASFGTVAHELAHYLFGTSDNTKDHTDKSNEIMKEIAELF